MSNIQFILTIAVCAAATMLTRFLPFLVFGSRGGKVPEVVEYLGHVLPAAIFGMLQIKSLRVSFLPLILMLIEVLLLTHLQLNYDLRK